MQTTTQNYPSQKTSSSFGNLCINNSGWYKDHTFSLGLLHLISSPVLRNKDKIKILINSKSQVKANTPIYNIDHNNLEYTII